MQVINTSRVTCHVPVVNGDGKADEITVQPRGRVHLAPDQRVEPSWRAPLGVLINPETPEAPAVAAEHTADADQAQDNE
jgi:hypothetical protein